MARPRKEAHERLSAALPPVRVSDAELIAIGDQARAAGLDWADLDGVGFDHVAHANRQTFRP